MFNFHFHRPQRSWGKVMFLQASVILLYRGWGCLPQCMLGTHPPRQQTPSRADPPGSRHPTGEQKSPPPKEQIPPWSRHPPIGRHPPEQTPPLHSMLGDTVNNAGGTHPTGMQSCYCNVCGCLLF